MHIGLLEDDAAIQEMLCLILQGEGNVITVYPGAEACIQALADEVGKAESPLVNLLIVDWRLPEPLSGIEVIRQIRDHLRLRSLPIILTTAATFNDIETLEELHASLLEKPFSIDELVALITQKRYP